VELLGPWFSFEGGILMVTFSRWEKLAGAVLVLILSLVLPGCEKNGKDGKKNGKGDTTDGENTKITKENYGKVKDGMTEKKVTEILGEPTESKDAKESAGKTLIWKNGNNTITITLNKEGKVESKMSVFVN
jgi:hypothetical protein